MKRLFALILSAVMLMGCMPAAQALSLEPMHVYLLLRSDVKELLGKEPMLSVVDQEMEGLLGAIVSEDDMMVLVFGPNTQGQPSVSVWSISDFNDTELMMVYLNLLRLWDDNYLLEYNNPKIPVQISYVSARLESGSLTVSDAETAMLLLDALDSTSPAAPTPKPTARATAVPTATPRPIRPLVPSALSFADYRISEDINVDGHRIHYTAMDGFSSKSILQAYADEYMALLTSKYGFVFYNSYQPSRNLVYYAFDYTGPGNVRPIVRSKISGDVIIEVWLEQLWFNVNISDDFDYLETDDRTTVNLR